MSIEKQFVVDKIEVMENGIVQVRTSIRLMENGVILSETLHRHVVCPGQDYSNESSRVQAICAAAHTPEVVQAFMQDSAASVTS